MSTVFAMYLVVTLLLLLASLADVCTRRSPVLQDYVWRITLLALFIAPTLVAVRPWLAGVQIPIPSPWANLSWKAMLEPEEASGELVASKANTGSEKPWNPVTLTNSPNVLARGSSIPGEVNETGANLKISAKAIDKSRQSSPLIAPEKDTRANSDGSVEPSETNSRSFRSALLTSLSLLIVLISLWKLGRFIVGVIRLRRIERTARPIKNHLWQDAALAIQKECGLSRLELRSTDLLSTPIIGNGPAPTILIPSKLLSEVDRPAAEQILMHEAKHLRRLDHRFNLLLQLSGIFLWTNPLYFWMRRRIRWLREVICDASVLERFDSIVYAETLFKLVSISGEKHTDCAVAMAVPRSWVGRRIHHLLEQSSTTSFAPVSMRFRCSVAIAIAFFILSIGFVRFAVSDAKAFAGASQESGKASKVDESELRGQITLSDGKPAGKAEVYLLKNVKDSRILPTEPLHVTADDQGKYAFQAVPHGSYTLWAETKSETSAEGFLKGEKVELSSAKHEQNLKLHVGCNYRVQVVSKEDQKPVQGAKITFGWTDIRRTYSTDEQGMVTIGGLAPNEWYFVVRKSGFGVTYRKLPKQPLAVTTELKFELDKGTQLQGIIEDQAGTPIPKVKIYANNPSESMTPGYGEAVTDDKGRFKIDSVPVGVSIHLSASADAYESNSQQFLIPVSVEEHQVRLVLQKTPYGGDCRLIVMDEEGTPIAKAQIENMGNSSNLIRSAETDEEGKAIVKNILSSFRGKSAFVRAPGYVTQEVQLVVGTMDEPGEMEVVLQKGQTIEGRIVAPDGKPGAGLRVYYNRGEQPWTTGGRVDSDQQGRFRIDGLPEQSTFTIYTTSPYAPINNIVLPVGTDEEVIVELEYEAVIKVRAFDEKTGEPIPEYNVRVNFSPDRRPGDPVMGLRTDLSNPGTEIMGEVKEFRLGHLPVGFPLQVTVSAPGYEKAVLTRVEAAVESEFELIAVKLKKEDMRQYQVVAGKLLDPNGKPVSGQTVRLVSAKASPLAMQWDFYRFYLIQSGQIQQDGNCIDFLTTTTNEKGEFHFPRVKKTGWIELFHFGGKIANGRYPIEGPDGSEKLDQLELVGEFNGRVSVSVEFEDESPVDSVNIEATNWSDNMNGVFFMESLRITKDAPKVIFENIPPGEYLVQLRSKPIANANGSFSINTIESLKITVEENETTEVEF